MTYFDADRGGYLRDFLNRTELHRTAGMGQPVRCAHCQRVYDLGRVEVTGRWLDCSVWKAPCCGRQVDSRNEGGGIIGTFRADYYPIEQEGGDDASR